MAPSPVQFIRPLGLALLALGLAGCPPCDQGPYLTIQVRDAQDNVVPFEQLRMSSASRPSGCAQGASGQLIESAQCPLLQNESVTITLQADGQPLTQAFTPAWKEHKDGCDFDPEALTIVLPGRGCPPPSGTAITGTLRDASGQETTGKVSLGSWAGASSCTVEGSAFSCPAQRSYPATYSLAYEVGFTRLQRSLAVDVNDCEVETADGTLDLAKIPCTAADRRSLSGSVQVRKGRAASVRVSLEGGAFRACEVDQPRSQDGVVYHDYRCPALTPTGGGEYVLELNDTVQTRTYKHMLLDNGCTVIAGAWNSYDLTRRDPAQE